MSDTNGIIEPLKANKSYAALLNALKTGKTPVMASGVIESQKCHLIYGLKEHLKRPVFIITNSELKAKHIQEDMRFFAGESAMLYPSKDIIFYSADVHSAEISRKRFEVADSIIKGENPIVTATVEALFDKLSGRNVFESYVELYEPGQKVDINQITGKLASAGYERVDAVEGAGQFSRRGGIIDIFPVSYENPVRIELWDDEIDSIRTFDPQTQRSIENINEARVAPFSEEIEGESSQVTFLDYLPKDTLIFLDETSRIEAHAKNVMQEYAQSIENRLEKGYITSEQVKELFDYEDVLKAASGFSLCLLENVLSGTNDFEVKLEIPFDVKQAAAFTNRLDILAGDINNYKKNKYRTLILGGPRTRCDRLVRELSEQGAEAFFVENPKERELAEGTAAVVRGSLHHGFEYPNEKFAVISDRELFGEVKARKKPRKKTGQIIESFTDLKPGDFVVHQSHGIGIFKGIEKTEIDGVTKDFIKIAYADGGMIGVSVNQLEMIQKYIGSEGYAPKLHKLGGADWERAKSRAKTAVKELARELIQLYAKRQASEGYSFSPDTLWQTEFEDTFPFEETDDQLNAIEDVKGDMESKKVMDRLVCGDVGYGKTEIALRAAFKCAQDGKQAAYLVPTTILAQQHYNTFNERMKNYPVTVEMLSRFKTQAQQKKIVEDIKKGTVDIIIATHRIISKDIAFKDLGLVIIDEEQRFGVAHKEKLKKLRENVDVLTLTATPIPRTLHMSITGIRDLSLLEEPPLDRRPVQTYVMEYDKQLIRDAVHRELARGGQVYYLHNRVKNITETVIKLQQLIPEARIACAHGQMGERELESIMIDFINGETDVLVCTTIVESGLDIPNVNTIIIQDADRMGLSQLYQLRGRVGRSNKLAYAYLCYRKDKLLSEIAEKRLRTIKEFTEFGSGFRVAMRDLEIRGAGSILGGEQHGHMEAVGYDMYLKLLGDAVKEEKNEPLKKEFETHIDISVDAYIPQKYIESETERLAAYKKIAQITSEADYYDVRDEIEDRYGNVPKQIQNLLEVALIKTYAHSLDVVSITEKETGKGKNVIITFKGDAEIRPEAITGFAQRNGGRVFFTAGTCPYLTIMPQKLASGNKYDEAGYIKNMLHDLKELNFEPE